MTIKHLVISGGGPIMIQILGAIQHLETNNFINMSEIETIYGTSAGAIVGILICLNFDWETINDYIIKRPWQDLFQINAKSIFDSYSKRGIFDGKIIQKCFKPLFDAKDIKIDITLKEFYDLSKIELHLFSFEINEYKTHDISYLTHPELTLIQAVQMTCGIPLLVSPVCINNKCYIDAGMSCNYPMNYCIESGKKAEEILGFKNKYKTDDEIINEESSLLDFLFNFLFKAVFSLSRLNKQPEIKNELLCDTTKLSFENFKSTLGNIEVRRDLFNVGIENAKTFLSNLENGV